MPVSRHLVLSGTIQPAYNRIFGTCRTSCRGTIPRGRGKCSKECRVPRIRRVVGIRPVCCGSATRQQVRRPVQPGGFNHRLVAGETALMRHLNLPVSEWKNNASPARSGTSIWLASISAVGASPGPSISPASIAARRFVASSVGFMGVTISSSGLLVISPQYFSPQRWLDGITRKLVACQTHGQSTKCVSLIQQGSR